jgi:hypothetical protein
MQQSEFQLFRFDTATLTEIVDFGSYFETSGRPAAVVTGTFTVEINVSGIATMQRTFALYNDDLVEDLTEHAFYRADKQKLLQLLNR